MKDKNMPRLKNGKLSLKQEKFIEAYMQNGGNATQATIEAGYKCKSREVAKSIGVENLLKPSIAGPLALRKSEIRAKTEDLREKCVLKLSNIIESPETKPATAIKAIDILGKMSGWHSNTTVLETNNRQKELTEAERQEAQRLAVLRFNPQYVLPAFEDIAPETMPAEIVDCSEPGATETISGEQNEPL